MTTTSRCSFCQTNNTGHSQFCLRCGEPLLIGRCAGSYRLIDILGAGGMGMVFRAEHVRLGTPFAVKLLHRKMAQNEKIAARFLLEAKATSTLRHEHIVFLADFGDMDPFGPYIAMEYLQGQPLSKTQQQPGGLSLRDMIIIGTQICDAMHFSHQQNMVHRDLKPDNVFMTQRDKDQPPFLKILDFGIAKVMQEESDELTKTGAVLGTPAYMAPEQGLGQHIDHRVDIYALCSILFQLCANRTPFVGESVVEILSQRMYHEAPLLSTFVPVLRDTKLEQLINKGLQRDKELRFSSMKELKESLLEAEIELIQRSSSALHTQPLQTLLQTLQFPALSEPAKASAMPTAASRAGTSDELQETGHHTPPNRNAVATPNKALAATIPPPHSQSSAKTPPEDHKPETVILSSLESLTAFGLRGPSKIWLFSTILLLFGSLSLGLWYTGYFSKTPNTPNQSTLQPSLSTNTPPQKRQPDPRLSAPNPIPIPQPRQNPDTTEPIPKQVHRTTPPKRMPSIKKKTRYPRRIRKKKTHRPQHLPQTSAPKQPPLRVIPPVRSAPIAQPQDGCPPNHHNIRWIRLFGPRSNVDIRIAGRSVPYRAKAKGWCIPYRGQTLSIQVDGTAQNLALCVFKLQRFSQRTLTISLQDAEEQDPGDYCVKGKL